MIRVENYKWGHQDNFKEGMAGWHIFQADSAGGIDVKGTVKNRGKKAVKKYSVYFTAYNGADEMVKCEATGKSIIGVCSADRLEPSCTQKLFGEKLWYNKSIRRVEIDHIDVVYADGTTESCKGNYVLTEEEQKEESIHNEKIKKGFKTYLKICAVSAIIIFLVYFFFLFKAIL